MVAVVALALASSLAHAADFPAADRSTQPISIVYPGERDVVGPLDGEFVLGSVIDQHGKLEINGQKIDVYKTGAFVAFLPVQPGTFTFHAALTLPGGATFFFDRTILNTPAPAPLPQKPVTIDPDSPWPRQDVELRAGDWLAPRVRATAGQKAQWRLGRLGWQPMREVNPVLGVYEGSWQVGPDDKADAAPVEYRVGGKSIKSPAKAAIAAGPPPIAAIKGGLPSVPLAAGPGVGELFPALGGARFATGGRSGNHTKLVMPGGLAGWIETKNLDFLPPGAQPPRAVTDVFSTKAGDGGTTVRFGLTERVPFSIEAADDLRRLTVKIYYATLHTRWVVYHALDPMVESIAFKQEAEGVVSATVALAEGQRLWGWRAAYEGASLRLELRRPPTIAEKGSPLKDRIVLVDPGHMPSLTGATGGLGTREMDVNFAIAERVKVLLAKEGARPILSRGANDDEVGLVDRPKLAWEKKADVFVSVHNNNLPSGANPFKTPHGYSVFYYQPQSLALAREIYKQYEKRVPIPGEETRFGDLLVLRMTEMPAVLTESAYLTLPEQEALLLEASFRESIAESIVGGLRDFFAAERRRQRARAKAAAR